MTLEAQYKIQRKLYHILNCQGTITQLGLSLNGSELYHILNCQGTITISYGE